MGENHNPEPITFILSAVLAFFAWITAGDVRSWMTIAASAMAIICGALGAYNHYLGIREKNKTK